LPVDTEAVDQLRRDWLEQCRRSDRGLLGGALWLGGILWLGLRLEPQPIGLVLGAVGIGLWLSIWLSRSR